MKKLFQILAMVTSSIYLFSCAPTAKYTRTTIYSVDPNTREQTKEGITIAMQYLNADNLKTNPLFRQPVLKAGWLTTKAEELHQEPTFVNPFEDKLVFNAKITNNTDHIIRMKDARVYYVKNQSMDDPIAAYTKQTFLEDLNSHPMVKKYSIAKMGYEPAIAASWKEALMKIISSNKCKIINDVGMEILPKFSASGFLTFPISPRRALEGKVSFFDVTTKVDNAGNPIEKQQFEFTIKSHDKYFRILGDQTTEISDKEFHAHAK